MTTQQPAIPSSLAVAANLLPEHWQNDVTKQLAPGENVLSSVEVDLDAKLHFRKGLVVVTSRRLLARSPGEDAWRDWTYRSGLQLRQTGLRLTWKAPANQGRVQGCQLRSRSINEMVDQVARGQYRSGDRLRLGGIRHRRRARCAGIQGIGPGSRRSSRDTHGGDGPRPPSCLLNGTGKS